MASSEPVFTRQNPIPPASTVRRGHYPPCKRSLSKKEKLTTLSPVRPSQSSSQQRRPLNQESQQLHETHDDGYSDEHVFREIWPATDYESSPDSNTASLEMMASRLSARPETPPSYPGVQDGSVLAKYMERFRHGQPQSREERQQVTGEEQTPFWWTSHSSVLSSTTTKAAENYGRDSASYSSAGQHQRDRSLRVSSDSSQGEYDDTEILHLQEQANKLLLRGECVQSDGSIPVSSDGLGCSDFSSPVSAEDPVRQPLVKLAGNVSLDPVHAASSQKSTVPTLAPPARPEEDILFQWRLRRKMEQAREWSQSVPHSGYQDSTFSWQTSSLTHPSASGQPYMQHQSSQPPQFPHRDAHPHTTAPQSDITKSHRLRDPDPSPSLFPAAVVSGSSSSQSQVFAHVPAHMHLLCDVLPCPTQSSHAKGKQSISQKLEEPQTKVVHKKIQVPESSSHGEKMSSSLPVSPGTAEGEVHSHQKVPEKEKNKSKRLELEKKMALSTRQRRKSTRSSSHQSLPRKVTSSREQHQQEGIQEFSTESCSRDHEPPPSPVHAALGQVVSEVLFPAAHSPPAQTVSTVSLPHTASSSSQSPLPSCSAQTSLEVISQLLQEAEDSDETEFEDDPLLKVLRQQRKWVKDHISEVDLILNESPEERRVT